jgi:hypothetical protein
VRRLILLLCLPSAVAVAAPPTAPAPVTPGPATPVTAAAAAPAPAAAPATPPAGPPVLAPPKIRVAITEHAIEGEGAAAPALQMQLQDGFVLGLVRGGIDVLDSGDVTKRLAGKLELEGCETSPCLKRLGELLAVRYVIRVRVSLTGNSYKMTARMFAVEGAAPAALPIAAQSRGCDVCTAGEAREQMIRLADGVRARIEERTAPPVLPPAGPPPRAARVLPVLTVAAGVAAIVGGALAVRGADGDDKPRSAIGGALMGAGLVTSGLGLYLSFAPLPLPDNRQAVDPAAPILGATIPY